MPDSPESPFDGPPRRDRRTHGDMLAGPPDATRPKNPWPRLLAFGLFLVVVVGLGGLCIASFAGAPTREVRVRDSEYELTLPKFLAITSFGADDEGRTFGAYFIVPDPQVRAAEAFFSRAPSGCNLRWDSGAEFEGTRGLFVDPCSDARYTLDGRALHEGAAADLHRFATRREANSYIVEFDRLLLGDCRGGNEAACTPPGQPRETRTVPSGPLPDDLGLR